ncbi:MULTISPECIES: GNAT family N-acetyltransferase [Variovorax]|jgi:predicted acetyltransferase|uniref:Acetyltransferase n=1 Tax=Variovorax paradoxus TaxID=34073 RepID=A0AA91I7X7_VARPD|nr:MULTISPECIES: GNAT family N-acetyltransferase [Variovorax]AVQ80685.1 GNAT family N-acetyltransferase [Variovorax sp. PMC12]OAK57606.1 acetyltransferase [Variovorax paradoxus]QRY29889.1 GNAT family N-acetyltransferase [Variovorax sp. PDNC026]
MELVWPAKPYLASYVSALNRGWARDESRPESGAEERAAIEADAALFLENLVDREAKGPPVTLPDGSRVPRLPGYKLWMWDGEFCGSIDLRWQPGTIALPVYCLGHIGYSVVPWKQRRGYATRALGAMLTLAAGEGLSRVEITTSPDNFASQKVILANGGVQAETFLTLPSQGSLTKFRYFIHL